MLFLSLVQRALQYGPVTHVNIGNNALFQAPDGLREACGALHNIQVGYDMYWYWRKHLAQDATIGNYVKAMLGHFTADLTTYSNASMVPGTTTNQRRFNQLIVDYYANSIDAVTLRDEDIAKLAEFVLQFLEEYRTQKGQDFCAGLTKEKLTEELSKFSSLTKTVKLGLSFAGKANVLLNKDGLSNGKCGSPSTSQVKKMAQFEANWAKESMAVANQFVENQPASNYGVFLAKVNDRVRGFETATNGSICNIK